MEISSTVGPEPGRAGPIGSAQGWIMYCSALPLIVVASMWVGR